ncbi:MAG: hypothetical protein PSX36_08655 [bacterium]|nr:hypothetical protein [bacterium]
MKNFIVLFLFACFSGYAQNKSLRVEVSYHESYCAGARPSDELLAEIQKPKPYANRSLVIIPSKGKACKVKTDALGIFQIKLKDGNYKVKEGWRHSKSSPNGESLSHFDKTCLKSEWGKVALELTVTNGNVTVVVVNEIVVPCAWSYPCLLEAHTPPVAE